MAIPIINVSILNGSNGFRLDGAEDNFSGDSVSNAGDINGDGFDDVMISASFYRPGDFYSGFSYVVFGKASGFDAAMDLSSLDGSNGFHLDATGDDVYSFSVSDAGDINGDGFDDVMIGAMGAYRYGFFGVGYVVFGRAPGFTDDINLSNLDGSNGFRLNGIRGQSIAVSGAGDVNGDGFDDVIVGDPASSSSYVVFGKASGFAAELNLSSLDGSNGFRLDGVAARDFSGYSVSSGGDINGDGFGDVIVGAPLASSNGEYRAGSSYVVFGKASGFAATFDLSSLDGSSGFRLDGIAANDLSGISVSSAGDVNGDGFDDLIIGALDVNTGGLGSSYVIFGRAAGFDATLSLSSLDGNNGFRLDGGRAVSTAGDVNGDGLDDLIVSALYDVDSQGILHPGSSYVVFGKASRFDATLALSSLDGSNGFRLEGVSESDAFGASVSGAGDINGDGFDDLIIGAPGADPNGESSGSSYIVFGGNFFTGEAVYLGTAGDDNLVGTELAERFEAGDGNDSMIGLGGADIFHGGDGDDAIAVADLDFQLADGGSGTDALELTGENIHLDLVDFHDTIGGIETIDLTGSGDNTLTLTLPDLLSLSDTADTFTVNGNGGDRIVGLSDGWTDAGFDGNYRVFINSGTILRVDRAVHTEVPIAGVINLADLDGSNGFRLNGTSLSDESVSNAGDVNGDGFDDVIISADIPSAYGNHSYVIFGKASGFSATQDLADLDGNNGFRLDGAGLAVSNAGDVNNDGYDDVIVGVHNADINGSFSGSSYVVFGRAAGFAATMDLSGLDGNNGFRMDGVAADDRSGQSVSNAGDVNGDGFDDVIIGAIGADSNGASYVVFGKSSGFDATVNLSALDGSNGVRLDGGSLVSSAGDVNGDGFGDVILGAYWASTNAPRAGASYVIFGHASGFDAQMDLSSLDGNNGFSLNGVAESDELGSSVSSAGDVNGDGFDDVIMGARGADPNGNYSAGSSYVVFGKAAGFDAALDLSNLDGNNGFRLDGVAADDRSGDSVSKAGDVNGDGFDDLLVGAFLADPNGNTALNSGASYVVFGKASGFDATLNLSNLDGSNGVRLDGVMEGDRAGASVSNAGDVNGDGFDDVIVSSFGYQNESFSGSSYVIFGRSDFGGGQLPTIPGTSGDDVLRGTSAAEIFAAGDGNDVLIGGGGADVFHGGAGVDQIKVPDLNFDSIDGGAGNDILHLAGADLNLDLTTLGGKIQGIETICIYGRGDNTLTLTADSVVNLSDTSNTLKLHGNAGDRVMVQDDGWVDGGVKGFYHTYTNDDAVLLVGANVTVEFV